MGVRTGDHQLVAGKQYFEHDVQLNSGIQYKTQTTTADTTLTQAECGQTVFVNGGTTHDVTLPSAVAGCSFTFFLTDATADVDIVQAAASEDFVGAIVDGAGTKDSAGASDTKIIFDQSGDNAAGVVFG